MFLGVSSADVDHVCPCAAEQGGSGDKLTWGSQFGKLEAFSSLFFNK